MKSGRMTYQIFLLFVFAGVHWLGRTDARVCYTYADEVPAVSTDTRTYNRTSVGRAGTKDVMVT